MKIVIEHDGLKRTIDGEFRICGAADDLVRLAEQITRQAEHRIDSTTGLGSYGWVDIREPIGNDPRSVNCPPVGWRQ